MKWVRHKKLTQDPGMQRPDSHVNSPAAQVTLPQFISSEWSPVDNKWPQIIINFFLVSFNLNQLTAIVFGVTHDFSSEKELNKKLFFKNQVINNRIDHNSQFWGTQRPLAQANSLWPHVLALQFWLFSSELSRQSSSLFEKSKLKKLVTGNQSKSIKPANIPVTDLVIERKCEKSKKK